MSDDPQRINLDEFRDRKPSTNKRKVQADPDVEFTVGDAREAAKKVADSKALESKSIEEISELVIRRMANVVLRAGDEFLPVSLKEASDNAKVWASVASMEAARRAGKHSGQSEEDPAVRDALAHLTLLQRKGGREK